MIRRTKNKEEDVLFTFAFNIQSTLYRLGLLLIIILILLQALHYYHVLQEKFSPAYSLGGNSMGRDTPMSCYGVFYFSANIKNDDNIIIRINGIPVKRIEKDKSIFVYISLLDVLEIDATKAQQPYEVIIEAEPTPFLPQGYVKKLNVQGKLYRLPSFYK